MTRHIRLLIALTLSVLTAALLASRATLAASTPERRFALVIGNSEYPSGPLPTAANDAGLIAQSLQAAGFDVIGARDLDGDSLRRTFRDFVEKVAGAGPDAVAFVYLAGHGLQYEGDNYFAGLDAKIDRDVDVPSHALRVNDFLRPLTALKPKALMVVMDTARENPYAHGGNPLAGGMSLVEPTPGTLYAFNASPGTIAKTETDAYGAYAQALAEMIREGGLPVNTLFDRVRLRVNEVTEGGSLPWHTSKIDAPFVFFELASEAPRPQASHQTLQARRERPVKGFSEAQEAYFAALERDTLAGYIDFLEAYPDHRLAKRVQAIVAARREATMWRKSRSADTPNAYWTYLDHYPDGPHAWDARRRLDFLTAPPLPPPTFTRFVYDDLPPPLEYEFVYVRRRPVFWFHDPVFAFAPPPPCPVIFLPPPLPPRFFRPPPPQPLAFVLPVPAYVPVAPFVRPVAAVVPPPNNPLATNIHQPLGPALSPPASGSLPAGIAPPPGVPPGGAPVPHVGGGQSGPGIGTAVGVGLAAGAAAAIVANRVALPPSLAAKAAATPAKPLAAAPVAPTPVLQPGQRPALPLTPPVAQVPAVTKTAPPLPSPSAALPVPGQPIKPAGVASPPAPSILQPRPATGTATPPPSAGTPPPAKPAVDPGATERQKAAAQAQQQAEQTRRDAQRAQQDAQRQREAQQQQREQAAKRQQQQVQQVEQQRRAEQQRQQQQAQARAQQQAQQQAQAVARAQQARAQAEAQARAAAQNAQAARAAAQQRAQSNQQRPRCGGPGLPPCPR